MEKQHFVALTENSSLSKFSIANPPSASLVGNITALSGSVLWQPRTANKPQAIYQPQSIQQGEELLTQNGTVTVAFPNTATVQLSKNAHISIIQTLPVDIVFQQSQGEVTYTALGSLPVSVRGLDILVSLKSAKGTVAVDPQKQLVIVLVKDGSVTAAYTDSNNTTQVLTVSQGKNLIFDNKKKVTMN